MPTLHTIVLANRFNCDSTAVRLPFDCNSTALRPFDDLLYVTTVGLSVCRLLHCGLSSSSSTLIKTDKPLLQTSEIRNMFVTYTFVIRMVNKITYLLTKCQSVDLNDKMSRYNTRQKKSFSCIVH